MLLHALPIAVLVLTLFYYWFALADRYVVFLYNHDMGILVADTSPFSPITASRYWMAGLVAGGVVTVLYTGACWLIGRLRLDYQPPPWWQVGAAAGALVLVGVPAIVMTANTPTLPAMNAAQTTLATLAALGLAVAPARIAARHPWRLVLLAVDGWAMAGIVLTVALSERALGMLERGSAGALMVLAVGLVGSVGLLLAMTVLLAWRRLRIPEPAELFAAGLGMAYLALPLLHHVAFTHGYYYITNSDNFFSRSLALQVVAWIVGAAIALGITAVRRALADRFNEA